MFTKKQIHLLQRIYGKFLYYARAINSTMMHALNDLASQVTTGTMKTEEAQACFFNYCATNPDAFIVYYASDMIVRGDTDFQEILVLLPTHSCLIGPFVDNNGQFLGI